MMLQATDSFPMNFGFSGKGNTADSAGLHDVISAGAAGLKLHEDFGAIRFRFPPSRATRGARYFGIAAASILRAPTPPLAPLAPGARVCDNVSVSVGSASQAIPFVYRPTGD